MVSRLVRYGIPATDRYCLYSIMRRGDSVIIVFIVMGLLINIPRFAAGWYSAETLRITEEFAV